MSDNQVTVKDLLHSVKENSAYDFEMAFNKLMMERVSKIVSEKYEEVTEDMSFVEGKTYKDEKYDDFGNKSKKMKDRSKNRKAKMKSHDDEEDLDEEYDDDDDEEDENDDKEMKMKEEVELDEANMSDEAVAKALNALRDNKASDATRKFARGMQAYYKKNGSYHPNQVAELQNIMKNATFHMAKSNRRKR